MTITDDAPINWHDWLRRWDAQQTGYLPDREERFATMLDVLEALLPPEFVALDLACGPGAISQRLLGRFPQARCIALDWDSVLLAIGRGVLGDREGRLRWVEADLRTDNWAAQVDEPYVDAVLSTTALHWLEPDELVRLYQHLGQLVRPGGVVLNGDHLPFGVRQPTFQRLAAHMDEQYRVDAFQTRGGEDWQHWWANIAATPGMANLIAERQQRFPHSHGDEEASTFDLHVAALRNAGFSEVDTIWQQGANRVLLAVR